MDVYLMMQQSVLQFALPRTPVGPISRSFSRDVGRSLVTPLQPGQISVAVQWYPTSREKRAGYGAPGSWQAKIL